MRTTNIKLLLLAITTCIGLLSCGKEVTKRADPGGGEGYSSNIITGEWFPHTGWDSQVTLSVSELTADILSNGKVLVFGKGGFEMSQPRLLPSHFDANYYAVKPEVGDIKLIVEGTGAISSSLEFRYILIPSSKIVTDNKLDYNDYNAVCDYYKIAK